MIDWSVIGSEVCRSVDNDTSSSSSDEDRPEGVNGGGSRAGAGSSLAATQRARHQPQEVLEFAAGLADDSGTSRTRSHWEALVLVASTYRAELSQSGRVCDNL